MKTYLFFDTETTGKADFRAPATAEHQPRLVQLGCILMNEERRELASLNLIVQPCGFEIPLEAAAIHGITTELAARYGVPLLYACQAFHALAEFCDGYVCHNTDFDRLIMDGELQRVALDLPRKGWHCTMKDMTPVCRLPGRYGDYKWPNLQEAHRHCFAREFDGAHDAMADVRACRDVFFWLRQRPAL